MLIFDSDPRGIESGTYGFSTARE